MSLHVVPISIQDANLLVARWHRHHGAALSGLFAVAAACDAHVCGAAIVGRPVARMLHDGWTAEVTRCVSDGTPNVCSLLYGACWRAAKALGYKRLVTYTLASEPGSSLKAAGYRLVGEAGGGSWSRPSRPRVDHHPLQLKWRWEREETA